MEKLKKPTPLWVLIVLLLCIFVCWVIVGVTGFDVFGQMSWLTGSGGRYCQPGMLNAFVKGLHCTWLKISPDAGWRFAHGIWFLAGYEFIEDGMVLDQIISGKYYGKGVGGGFYNLTSIGHITPYEIRLSFKMDGAFLEGTYQFKINLIREGEVITSKVFNLTIESNTILPKTFEFAWDIEGIEWDVCEALYYKGWTRSAIGINSFFFYLITFYPYLLIIPSIFILSIFAILAFRIFKKKIEQRKAN